MGVNKLSLLSILLAIDLCAGVVRIEPMKATPFNANLQIDFDTNHSVLSRNEPLHFHLKSFPLGIHIYSESLTGMRQNNYGTTVLVLLNGEHRIYLKKLDMNPLKKESQSYEKHFQKYISTKIARELKEGKNTISAIPLSSFGESIKQQKAIQTKIVDFGKRSQRDYELEEKLNRPYILYNEPSGSYLKGEPILLDFVVCNTTLSKGGDRVLVKIDGEEVATLDQYVPYKITQMPLGHHIIKLTLIDAKGATHPNPFCEQQCTITVE